MFSVVIPAYNAKASISKCLDGLVNQSIDRSEYEVIVVDDGSTDSTADIVQDFENVRLIKQDNQGPASARNNGAKHATGDIILFTDSDCIPEKNWIEQMIRPFNDNAEIVGVKGIYKTDQKELIARFVQAEYEDKYDVLKRDQYIDFVDTYSAGFKRKVFLEFGGYDTSFPVACAEDVELSFRMFSRGYKMVFNPNAIVSHRHPATLTGYLKKKYKFAFWRILAVRKNPNKIIKDSHTPQIMKLQLLFFPLLIISLLATIFYPRAIYLGFLVIAVFIISTIPFLKKVIKKDIAVGLLSPFLLMTRSVFQLFGVLNGTIQHIVIK
jgi:GT2 family glycosyltransferase